MAHHDAQIDLTVDDLVRLAASFQVNGETLDPPPNLLESLQNIASQVKEFSLDGQAMNRLLLSPFRERLIDTYGPEDGSYRYGEVVKVFRG